MTGVLPIAKYSSGSELNMFSEYDMLISEKFSEYFGFSDAEVERLYEIYQKRVNSPAFSREDLRIWYRYRVEREEKAGKGFVDFIFYPRRRKEDAIILELKVDSTPEKAVDQIKNRDYVLRFQGKLGEESEYTGRILAVGISYTKKTKEHRCKIEILKR